MPQTWEHATLSASSATREIMLVTARGESVINREVTGSRHIMIALDEVSADGWDLVGPPAIVYTDKTTVTTYLLRRPKAPEGEPQVW